MPVGLSDERVQLNAAGQVELKLTTAWRDGTTHLVMSPLEFTHPNHSHDLPLRLRISHSASGPGCPQRVRSAISGGREAVLRLAQPDQISPMTGASQ